MGLRVAAMALLVACVPAQGQTPTAPGQAAAQASKTAAPESQAPAQGNQAALDAELKLLSAQAQSLQRDLPSFECQEAGTSQVLKKAKVKQQVRFVADLRVERGTDARLHERLAVTQVNGKPLKGRFEPRFMVHGGFDQSLLFFLPSMQTCFRFTLSSVPQGGRIDFTSPPGTFDRPQCKETGAPSGFVLFDAAGNATRLERTVPPENAPEVSVVNFAASSFASVELDGRLYPLTSKVVADVPKEDNVSLHFEAEYTGCHLFKATSRILPGIAPVPDSGAPHP